MSVVGIDFGAQSTKVGVARNKGIDIVRIHAPPPDDFFPSVLKPLFEAQFTTTFLLTFFLLN
jgi:molecular chaperone DnaK (HSP70)